MERKVCLISILIALSCSPTLGYGEASSAPLALRLTAKKSIFQHGEGMALRYALENVSPDPVMVFDPTVAPHPIEQQADPLRVGIHCVVTGEQGREAVIVRHDQHAAMRLVEAKYFRALQPKETLEGVITFFNDEQYSAGPADGYDPDTMFWIRWVLFQPVGDSVPAKEGDVIDHVFAHPGRYLLICNYSNSLEYYQAWEDERLARHPNQAWLGTVKSNTMTVEIVAGQSEATP